MPIYYHSQLNVYEECPLKYKLCYRDKVKRDEVEGVEGFLLSVADIETASNYYFV
jgi:hypothetical protein